jgi:2-methylcitrate dehydratase PrpD
VITTILPVIHNIIEMAKEDEISYENVESITISAGKRITHGPLSSSILDFGPFINKTQAYKSLPCAVAIALVYGDVSAETVGKFQDPNVSITAGKVSVNTNESYDGFFNSIEIKTTDNTVYEIEGDDFPSLTSEQVDFNIIKSTSRYLGDDRAKDLVKFVRNLENHDVDEISSLLS